MGDTSQNDTGSASKRLQDHLKSLGCRFGMGENGIMNRLKKVMPRNRFEPLMKLLESSVEERESNDALYDLAITIKEGNLLFSLQAEISIACYLAVYETLCKRTSFPETVWDFGCGTGSFVSWLAKEHPGTQFVAIDKARITTDAAKIFSKQKNLKFVNGDYLTVQKCMEGLGPPDFAYSVFGLEFVGGRSPLFDLKGTSLRDNRAYRAAYDKCLWILRAWSNICPEGSHLFLISRISSAYSGIAVVDAARNEGWDLDLGSFRKLHVDGESFPCLTFLRSTKATTSLLDEEVFLRQWVETDMEKTSLATPGLIIGNDGLAMLEYRNLHHCTAKRTTYDIYPADHIMKNEIGEFSGGFYCYKCASTGFRGLYYNNATSLSLTEFEQQAQQVFETGGVFPGRSIDQEKNGEVFARHEC